MDLSWIFFYLIAYEWKKKSDRKKIFLASFRFLRTHKYGTVVWRFPIVIGFYSIFHDAPGGPGGIGGIGGMGGIGGLTIGGIGGLLPGNGGLFGTI